MNQSAPLPALATFSSYAKKFASGNFLFTFSLFPKYINTKKLKIGLVLSLICAVDISYAQVTIPYVNGQGPMSNGSLLNFESGGAATAIQENWGLNLNGENLSLAATPYKPNRSGLYLIG